MIERSFHIYPCKSSPPVRDLIKCLMEIPILQEFWRLLHIYNDFLIHAYKNSTIIWLARTTVWIDDQVFCYIEKEVNNSKYCNPRKVLHHFDYREHFGSQGRFLLVICLDWKECIVSSAFINVLCIWGTIISRKSKEKFLIILDFSIIHNGIIVKNTLHWYLINDFVYECMQYAINDFISSYFYVCKYP